MISHFTRFYAAFGETLHLPPDFSLICWNADSPGSHIGGLAAGGIATDEADVAPLVEGKYKRVPVSFHARRRSTRYQLELTHPQQRL